MQIKIFTIPLITDDVELDKLNHFLRAQQIIDVKRELAQIGTESYWTFCIMYLPNNKLDSIENSKPEGGRQKIDYKEVLDKDTFERFAKMRKLRKDIAESEAIPAYAVFTDAELSEIAKLQTLDINSMLKIPGIGKKKVEKYGDSFCQMVSSQNEDEESTGTIGTDSQS